jgi:UDP-N-acetylmuramoyl-tripeptide--D-alanyl-D-alanine ligase
VVTPGMVELGNRQYVENVMFAKKAAAVATDVIIVGRTNRRALLAGVGDEAAVTLVGSTEEGVGWIRANLRAGDAVLYENDLPDHYP